MQGVLDMFVDHVVIAGVGTVILMVSFFGGLYYFLRKDMDKNP